MTDTIARVIVNESGSIVDVVTEEGYNRLATTTYVSASVLPSGAATEATLQDVSSSLVQISSSLEDRLGTLGQKAMSGSTPVVIASDQTSVLVEATISDHSGSFADLVKSGTRTAIAVEYPLLLADMRKITREVTIIRRHMEAVTDSEWDPDIDDDVEM